MRSNTCNWTKVITEPLLTTFYAAGYLRELLPPRFRWAIGQILYRPLTGTIANVPHSDPETPFRRMRSYDRSLRFADAERLGAGVK